MPFFALTLPVAPVILLSIGPFRWLLRTSLVPGSRIFARPISATALDVFIVS